MHIISFCFEVRIVKSFIVKPNKRSEITP